MKSINYSDFKEMKRINSKEQLQNSNMNKSYLKNDVSFSMFYDNNKRINNIKISCDKNINKIKKLHFQNIETRNLKIWVEDHNIIKCYSCNTIFSFFVRKHHCRCCGRIFCYHCCNDILDIPEQITENELPIQSLSNNIGILSKDTTDDLKHQRKDQRVCLQCKKKIFDLNKLNPLIQVFELLDLNVKDYRNMKNVCKTWMCIANYYLSNFREIQYSLPNHYYTTKEKKMLLNNRFLFYGHSKLIVQLIKSIDWNNVEKDLEQEILHILYNKNKKCKCWALMCTRDCRRLLKAEDCIQLLYPEINNYKIRDYALVCLSKTSIEELLCYLPFLIYHIRYELLFENNYSKLISKFIIDKSKRSKIFALQSYWELYIQSDDIDYKLVDCYKKLMKILESTLNINFKKTQEMISIFETFQNSTIENITNTLEKNDFTFENIPFPFTKNSKIDCKNVKRMRSTTQPLMFTYYSLTKNNLKRQILFKYEDIRKENIIMKIIKLMDIILKRDKIDLNFVTYDILSVGKSFGFISIVPNSKTLYNIELNERFSIQNYIIEKNPNLPINMIRSNFIKSCAASCVISYLLGLGDRHLDNIMITDTGLLFHIDFGYILGYEPKPMAPEMKITPEMIDAMGGQNSAGYKEFQILCSKSYNCLRRHSNKFLVLLSMLSKLSPPIDDGKFTEEFIKNQIIKRFIPGELYKEAELQYKTKIINCYGTGTIIDYLHYHKKETIDKNIDIITGFISNIGTSISSYFYTSPTIE